jgi:cap2 methyltransferase
MSSSASSVASSSASSMASSSASPITDSPALLALANAVKMIIDSDYPRAVYQRRKWDAKKDIRHWGQRKLLFSEILFLTRWGHLSTNIVYAGAAPGAHIPYLSGLFPNHTFVLVDPNPFQVEESEKIRIINGYFTNEIAKEYSEKGVLFVSDIRTADYRQMTPIENEQYIIKDNEAQIQWITIMKPVKSMLKFRCPYPDLIKEPTRMYKGQIFIQAWAPPTSTETRLVVDDSLEMHDYDNYAYEEQLFHHNSVVRFQQFDQPIKAEGLGKGFDDSVEVVILSEFLQKYPEYIKGQSLYKTIAQMSSEISRAITKSNRTLATPMKDPELRRQFPKVNHTPFHNKKH